jgi:tetratricopeptide (TPR) repeat protein
MPFGKKTDASGETIDFDAVYREIIHPAIEEAGLEPIRADEEATGGIIHKPMFERLILCEFAVADLTTANANVFYELGLRHAARPWTTVPIFAEGGRLPFDVTMIRGLPYKLGKGGVPSDAATDAHNLALRLVAARNAARDDPKGMTDSPIYQLVENFPEVDHTKTDVFRDRVLYSNEIKKKLAAAREKGIDAVREVEKEIGDLGNQEAGAVIDLFLSYRAVKGWDDMIALVDKMSRPLAATVLVQEQYALALNRAKRSEEAEKVLLDLIKQRGNASETLGILGRVYKDRWEAARAAGEKFRANGLLEKAIDAYLRGFEADWRDSYPGINAVTLMELKEPPDPRRNKLLPLVTYAVEQRVAKGEPDYWDHATLLELAVLANDQPQAMEFAGQSLAAVRERWEPETTARNLRLIREVRAQRNEEVDWIREIEEALLKEA